MVRTFSARVKSGDLFFFGQLLFDNCVAFRSLSADRESFVHTVGLSSFATELKPEKIQSNPQPLSRSIGSIPAHGMFGSHEFILQQMSDRNTDLIEDFEFCNRFGKWRSDEDLHIILMSIKIRTDAV